MQSSRCDTFSHLASPTTPKSATMLQSRHRPPCKVSIVCSRLYPNCWAAGINVCTDLHCNPPVVELSTPWILKCGLFRERCKKTCEDGTSTLLTNAHADVLARPFLCVSSGASTFARSASGRRRGRLRAGQWGRATSRRRCAAQGAKRVKAAGRETRPSPRAISEINNARKDLPLRNFNYTPTFATSALSCQEQPTVRTRLFKQKLQCAPFILRSSAAPTLLRHTRTHCGGRAT